MSRRKSSRWQTIALWSAPLLLLLGVGGFFAARAAIDAYLRSERFRTFLAEKAGRSLHAEAAIAPLHFDATSLYTDSFAARGTSEAAFSELRLEGIRAELSWRRFFEKVWQVDRVDIQRVHVDLEGPRTVPPAKAEKPREPAPPRREEKTRGSGWLPNRVEIAAANVRETNLRWKDGGLRGTAWQIQPGDGGWNFEGAGGSIGHGTLPPLDVQRIELRYREPSIFVNRAEFRQGTGGSVVASGEVNLDRELQLHASIKNVALTPWLAGDWRVRLRGDASGEVDIRTPLPARGAPEIRGTLSLANGQLEALPVLDEIAAFTRTQQFRRLALNRATAEFVRQGSRLTVTNLVIESDRLIRIEGGFVVESGLIDGTFQVGVTPGSLQWLPGSQARVFTESRGAYAWAPMRLTGPLDAPKEDLSARLTAAAAGAVIDQAVETVRDVTKGMKDATRGVLDLLLTPPK